MTDSRFQSLSILIHSSFDQFPAQRVRATFREHSGRAREWYQRRRGLAYDLGPGDWHAQLWRSWWQAPHFWRHECSPDTDPSHITSGLLIRGTQWWSYRSLPQMGQPFAPMTVVTGHGQTGSSLVLFLSGTGGQSARDNAALWPWIDFSQVHRPWDWAQDDGLASDRRLWRGRSLFTVEDAPIGPPPHPGLLFRSGDAFECWVDPSSGFPLRFSASFDKELVWELTVDERCLDGGDIAPDVFLPPWIMTAKS